MQNWERLNIDPIFRANMLTRSNIVEHVRQFFLTRGFFQAETPIMVATPGMEPYLDPFATTLRSHDDDGGKEFKAYLITSPEYALKKLLAGGMENVFEITKTFRNHEPWDGSHNPEFTMIEWYRAHENYTALMRDVEDLVCDVAERAKHTKTLMYEGKNIDLSTPWDRMTVAEAFARYAQIDLARGIDDPEWFRAIVDQKGCGITPADTFDDVFFKIFLRDIEPKLGFDKPVFLYEYPRSMAALAKLKSNDNRFAERVEVYCGGLELANGYTELTDATEQRRRLEQEREFRQTLGKTAFDIDEQFIKAVGLMPECTGIAFGIDRLVMLLLGVTSIRDTMLFPASDLFL